MIDLTSPEVEDLLYEARHFIDRHLKCLATEMVQLMEPEAVYKAIEQIYPGGWAQLEADRDATLLRMSKVYAEATHEESVIAKWWRLRRTVNGSQQDFFVRPYMDVLKVDIEPLQCRALFRHAEIKEGTRRDTIKRRGMTLRVWTRTSIDSAWGDYAEVTAWEDEAPLEYVKWGRIRTAEIAASDDEQAATCFRPGTHKSPLDGPARKLGLTRKEFHQA